MEERGERVRRKKRFRLFTSTPCIDGFRGRGGGAASTRKKYQFQLWRDSIISVRGILAHFGQDGPPISISRLWKNVGARGGLLTRASSIGPTFAHPLPGDSNRHVQIYDLQRGAFTSWVDAASTHPLSTLCPLPCAPSDPSSRRKQCGCFEVFFMKFAHVRRSRVKTILEQRKTVTKTAPLFSICCVGEGRRKRSR